MGYRPAHLIEKAAMYLLRILQEKGQIDYDFFYDGEERTLLQLIEGIGIIEEDAEHYVAEALTSSTRCRLFSIDTIPNTFNRFPCR